MWSVIDLTEQDHYLLAMKKLLGVIGIGFLGFISCDQKKSPVNEKEHVVQTAVTDEKVRTISPEHLGMASRMPESAEFYMSVHGIGDLFYAFTQMDVMQLFFDFESDEAALPEKEERQEMVDQINQMMVKDAFVCIDSGVAEKIATIGGTTNDYSATQMRLLAQIISRTINQLSDGFNFSDVTYETILEDFQQDSTEMARQLAEKLIAEGEVLEVPSLYLGCTPPEGKQKEWTEAWVKSTQQWCEENDAIAPHSFEKYGARFQGVQINIGDLANEKQLEQETRKIDPALEEVYAKVEEKIRQLSLIVVCGLVDDMLVMYVGADADSLVFVDDAETSLAARPEFKKLGVTEDASLFGVCYASESFQRSFLAWTGYEKSYLALADAFRKEKLPNSDEIIKNFRALAKLEAEMKVSDVSPFLAMAMFEDGLKIETIGGYYDRAYDYSQPLQLTSVADEMKQDLFMRIHWRGNRDWKEMQLDYLEQVLSVFGNVVEGGYLAFLEDDEESAEKYRQWKMVYEEIVNSEVNRLWQAYRKSFRPSLDSEAAILVDLNGSMPRLPLVPSRFIEEGKMPRVMYVRPVKSRSALDDSYLALDETTENTLEYFSILTKKNLVKPDFLSAEKGKLTTWFYPFPTMTNDFVPSVSISESLLMFSSSKNFSEALYEDRRGNVN